MKLYISTGTYKKTILCVPDNSEPVKDVVKQSAFSYITSSAVKEKTVLDLYAGSGQLGFEALSNGASYCVFVDEDYNSKACVKKTTEKLNLTNTHFIHKDALKVIGESDEKFGLVLADPPYTYKHKHLLKTAHYVMKPDAIFVFFHSSSLNENDLIAVNLQKIETRTFGKSAYSAYRNI